MPPWQTADPDASLATNDVRPPVETTFADAQPHVNFVVHEPAWLPADCAVTEVTRRPEQPPGRPGDVAAADIGQTPHSDGNPSSLRAIVEGDGRRLRLKAFCYDWAPCSASLAPLWRTPDPTPVDCGDAVGWLGTDYKDNRGACVQRDRTQVELSVEAGAFTDDELARVLDGLERAVPREDCAVDGVPFHRLQYWSRYGCRPPVVPHGLWDYAPARPYEESRPVSAVGLASDPPVRVLAPADDRYALDSALAFPGRDAVECVYRHRGNASDHLWVTAADADSALAPEFPLSPAEQAAETRERVALRGTSVHYAALTDEHGAWEALWEEDGTCYAVHAGASHHFDGEAFRALVDGFEAP